MELWVCLHGWLLRVSDFLNHLINPLVLLRRVNFSDGSHLFPELGAARPEAASQDAEVSEGDQDEWNVQDCKEMQDLNCFEKLKVLHVANMLNFDLDLRRKAMLYFEEVLNSDHIFLETEEKDDEGGNYKGLHE